MTELYFKQLKFDADKYLVTENFYKFLVSVTNGKSYSQCRSIVRDEIKKALKGEVKKVSSFSTNKIHFEL